MQFSTQSRVAILLIFLCSLLSISHDAAGQDGYTIRIDANVVQLAFAASDRQGKVIKTLQSSDVAVVDNGWIIRQFHSFRPASKSPVDLVILLDVSDSVKSQMAAELAELKDFLQGSAWGERDRVSIIAFGGSRPQLLCEAYCHRGAAEVKLDSLSAQGTTPLYDALMQGAELLKSHYDPDSRAAMILFSDGLDTISMHSAGEVSQTAQNLQSAIYSINSRSAKHPSSEGDAMLAYLSASTGGLSFESGKNAIAILRGILDDLHSGYVLTYELPQQPAGHHAVRILATRDPRLQFRSRQAYSGVE